MLRPKSVQIPMAGSQALLVVISAMLRFHATGKLASLYLEITETAV